MINLDSGTPSFGGADGQFHWLLLLLVLVLPLLLLLLLVVLLLLPLVLLLLLVLDVVLDVLQESELPVHQDLPIHEQARREGEERKLRLRTLCKGH